MERKQTPGSNPGEWRTRAEKHTCPDCRHHVSRHWDGICGDLECSIWQTFPDHQCPSQRDAEPQYVKPVEAVLKPRRPTRRFTRPKHKVMIKDLSPEARREYRRKQQIAYREILAQEGRYITKRNRNAVKNP